MHIHPPNTFLTAIVCVCVCVREREREMAILPAVIMVLVLCMSSEVIKAQQLQVGFYANKCNVAEAIVKQEVEKAFFNDKGIAPGLLRMHFHDCFVMGCDASIMIDSTPNNVAEKDSPANGISLRGIEVIERAKARIEAACHGVVSCADILSFAARDSVVITGGLGWEVPAGRRDGRVSLASATIDIPAPFFNLTELIQSFANKGLSEEEMVVLSGAHTIGRSHCTSFSDRLYNSGPMQGQDPTLHPLYALRLKKQCPRGLSGSVDPNLVVEMNISPALFENSYYSDVLHNRGLFTSDQALTTSPDTRAKVVEYAIKGLDWQKDFRDAMVKMSQIDVKTGNSGEIRINCRMIN